MKTEIKEKDSTSKKDNLKSRAYTYIKGKILECVFLPGDFLQENKLMAELNISRTPIREAISALDREGLVKIIPGRGVTVNEIGYQEIYDIFQVRLMVEPSILQTNYNKVEKDKMLAFKEAIQGSVENDDTKSQYQIDDNFHAYFIGLCANKYLVRLLENIFDQNHRLRVLTGNNANRLLQSSKEHVNIIDALLKDDVNEAIEHYIVHIQNSEQSSIKLLRGLF